MKRLSIISLAFLSGGCGLSGPAEGIDGETAARAVTAASGVQLRRSDPPKVSPQLFNLRQAFAGISGEERVLLLVFDTEQATEQVLGGRRSFDVFDTEAIRHRNVVVLYSPGVGAGVGELSGDGAGLRSALRALR